MKRTCPNPICAARKFVIKDGLYRRKDDSKYIQRFRCKNCKTRFSSATFSDAYRQKKRRINWPLLEFLASGLSMRRSAMLLKINRRTVEKKMPYLGIKCRKLNAKYLLKLKGKIHNIQIDDLITKENSKLKPLSVSIAVDENRRTILALEVSQIPAFGHLSKVAVKKYGARTSEHFEGLTRLFQTITPIVSPEVLVKSDEHKLYPGFISAYLPKGKHLTFPSERGCIAGQGEMKKTGFDPIFIVNHTCAMLRGNVNRLIRKTWCTTKDPARLKDHLDVFMFYYNQHILPKALTPL
jgi:transposase-like protein